MNKFSCLLALGLVLFGCSKEGYKTSSDKAAAEPTAVVEVPNDGKKFAPPIEPEQLPAGAWYCDMGTVHYARMNEGDKTCPICEMTLKQKP